MLQTSQRVLDRYEIPPHLADRLWMTADEIDAIPEESFFPMPFINGGRLYMLIETYKVPGVTWLDGEVIRTRYRRIYPAEHLCLKKVEV